MNRELQYMKWLRDPKGCWHIYAYNGKAALCGKAPPEKAVSQIVIKKPARICGNCIRVPGAIKL